MNDQDTLHQVKLRSPFRPDELMFLRQIEPMDLVAGLLRRGSIVKNFAYDISWTDRHTMEVLNPISGDLVVECKLPQDQAISVSQDDLSCSGFQLGTTNGPAKLVVLGSAEIAAASIH